MAYKVLGTEQFEEFARKAKAAGTEGKGLLKEIRKGIQDGAEPVAEDARRNVLGLSSRARGSGSRAKRTTHLLSKRKKASARVKAKVHAGSGLRSLTARATQVQVSMGASSARARIRVNTSLLPPDQRKLPAYMNKGSWRHPVMGNRRIWVTQTVSQPGWFDRAMDKGGPKVREHAFSTVKQFLGRF